MRIESGIYWESDRKHFRYKVMVRGKTHEGTVKGLRHDRQALREAKKLRDEAKSSLRFNNVKVSKIKISITYEEAKQKYLENLEVKKRSGKIKESTIERYKTDFNTHIDSFFSDKRLAWMNDPSNLLEFQNVLLSKKKQLWIPKADKPYLKSTDDNLSHASINRACELIKTFLNTMAELKLIETSEYNLLSLEERSDDEDKPIAYFETLEETNRFLSIAKKWTKGINGSGRTEVLESPYYHLYLVAIYSGLRKGELKGLNEEDIDFKKGCITVRRQWLTSLKRFGPTKSGKKRYVSFDPNGQVAVSLHKAIAQTRSIQRDKQLVSHDDLGAVFSSINGKRIIGDSFCGKHFNSLLKQANLNPEITFHGLRRTFANWYYRQVGQIQPVQEMLGHQSEVTTRIYLNLNEKTLPPVPICRFQ